MATTADDAVARLQSLLAGEAGVTDDATPDQHLVSRNREGDPEALPPNVRPRPCAHCGRTVHQYVYPGNDPGERAYCSYWCRRDYWNKQAKVARAAGRQKPCTVCGEAFDGTRRDQVTCSPACRQKAYRQRKGAGILKVHDGAGGAPENGRRGGRERS